MIGENAASALKQLLALCLIECRIIGQTFLCFFNIGPSLIQRQRQATEELEDSFCLLVGLFRDLLLDHSGPIEQELYPFGLIHLSYFDFLRYATHSIGAGGEENVAFGFGWQI